MFFSAPSLQISEVLALSSDAKDVYDLVEAKEGGADDPTSVMGSLDVESLNIDDAASLDAASKGVSADSPMASPSPRAPDDDLNNNNAEGDHPLKVE